MIDTTSITEHMEVVGSDGMHVGTVDNIDTGRVKLTKSDPASGGEHHFVPLTAIDRVADKVYLSMPAAQAKLLGDAPGRA